MSSLDSWLTLYQMSATTGWGSGVFRAAQQPVDGLPTAFSVNYWPFALLLITEAGSLPICVNPKQEHSLFVASSRPGCSALGELLVPTLHGSRFTNEEL